MEKFTIVVTIIFISLLFYWLFFFSFSWFRSQVTQVDDEVSQQIITTGEPFGEYSFAVENYVVTSSGEPARRIEYIQTDPDRPSSTVVVTTSATVDSPVTVSVTGVDATGALVSNITGGITATTSSLSSPSNSSSLSTIFKEFNESQKKIEQLVTNLVTTNEVDGLQTENIKLKLELDEAIRKFRGELESKEIQLQEEKNRADQIKEELENQLTLERLEKEKLEEENEKLRQLVKQYEIKFKEEEEVEVQSCTISQVSDAMSCNWLIVTSINQTLQITHHSDTLTHSLT